MQECILAGNPRHKQVVDHHQTFIKVLLLEELIRGRQLHQTEAGDYLTLDILQIFVQLSILGTDQGKFSLILLYLQEIEVELCEKCKE
ncbi:hypothetical protein DPMN_176972 [Dreissena polymorpha]|uniref:Uncharacterized protein n=1 Tax=Dreissena polymorpha TaxID=45954 RepID=A0A9D4IK42_DREPO|nr:hypothetical protein DPMN_176972 [Dreissena polymorpha]